MHYKHGGLRQQWTEDQVFISLHLKADQFRKTFTIHVVSLNIQDLLLAVLAYMQHQ